MICQASPISDGHEAPRGSPGWITPRPFSRATKSRLAVHCAARNSGQGRGGVTAATLDSKSSAREGVRVQLPPPVPFLDNIPQRLVGWSLAWGCSSVGRAQGWQSWGQGFEPPQLHQLKRHDGTRQAIPSQHRLPRSFSYPDLLKERARRPSAPRQPRTPGATTFYARTATRAAFGHRRLRGHPR
jgi:hypothetical protein